MIDPREEMIERLVIEKREAEDELYAERIERRQDIVIHEKEIEAVTRIQTKTLAQRDEALSALRNIGSECVGDDPAMYARQAMEMVDAIARRFPEQEN